MIIVLAVTGCGKLRPYRVDVEQGNVINQDAIAKLHPGLNKNQVVAILGEPLLDEMFDHDALVYAYTKQINGGQIIKKRLILTFKNHKLISISQ